jgi:hypothetical protein
VFPQSLVMGGDQSLLLDALFAWRFLHIILLKKSRWVQKLPYTLHKLLDPSGAAELLRAYDQTDEEKRLYVGTSTREEFEGAVHAQLGMIGAKPSSIPGCNR